MAVNEAYTPSTAYTFDTSNLTAPIPWEYISPDHIRLYRLVDGEMTPIDVTKYDVEGSNIIMSETMMTHGETFYVRRKVPLTQPYSSVGINRVSPTDLERALDRVIMAAQELQSRELFTHIIEDMQSLGYISGVQGWRLGLDGDAEINGRFNGEANITGGTISENVEIVNSTSHRQHINGFADALVGAVDTPDMNGYEALAGGRYISVIVFVSQLFGGSRMFDVQISKDSSTWYGLPDNPDPEVPTSWNNGTVTSFTQVSGIQTQRGPMPMEEDGEGNPIDTTYYIRVRGRRADGYLGDWESPKTVVMEPVGEGDIGTGAIVASLIAAEAVTAGKIAAGSITADRLTANVINGILAQFNQIFLVDPTLGWTVDQTGEHGGSTLLNDRRAWHNYESISIQRYNTALSSPAWETLARLSVTDVGTDGEDSYGELILGSVFGSGVRARFGHLQEVDSTTYWTQNAIAGSSWTRDDATLTGTIVSLNAGIMAGQSIFNVAMLDTSGVYSDVFTISNTGVLHGFGPRALFTSGDGVIDIGPTGWRTSSRSTIKLETLTDNPSEIDLIHTVGSAKNGWQLSARGTAQDESLNFYTNDDNAFTLRARLSKNGGLDVLGMGARTYATGNIGPGGAYVVPAGTFFVHAATDAAAYLQIRDSGGSWRIMARWHHTSDSSPGCMVFSDGTNVRIHQAPLVGSSGTYYAIKLG